MVVGIPSLLNSPKYLRGKIPGKDVHMYDVFEVNSGGINITKPNPVRNLTSQPTALPAVRTRDLTKYSRYKQCKYST